MQTHLSYVPIVPAPWRDRDRILGEARPVLLTAWAPLLIAQGPGPLRCPQSSFRGHLTKQWPVTQGNLPLMRTPPQAFALWKPAFTVCPPTLAPPPGCLGFMPVLCQKMISKNLCFKTGLVAYTLIPERQRQRQEDYCKFKASLEDPISKKRSRTV